MPDKPNLIFIMPDQLRHDFLSCYGASFIETPNIDALGQTGVTYRNAYSEHPVCVPARCALITGMNAIKTGVVDNGQFIRPDYQTCGIQTWPEILNENGYMTVATGKMHFYPWEKRMGFQHRISAEDKFWGFIQDDYYQYLKPHGYSKTSFADVPEYHENFQALVSPLPWKFNVDHFVGMESVRWIGEYEGDQPFAMMVGFPGPHVPYDPTEEYATFDPNDMPEPIPEVPEDTALMRPKNPSRSVSSKKSWYATNNNRKPEKKDFLNQRAHYAGLIRQIDDEVGAIVDALQRKGILDNTIIIFSSDHGDYLGDHGLTGKGSYYEASCHVPMLVRHPNINGPVVSEHLVTLNDVIATMLTLAGCEVPSYMDSVPLPDLGLSNESPRDRIIGFLRSGWMMFDGEWKLCKHPSGSHLFNLKNDPTEEHNLVRDSQYTDVYQKMDAEITAEIIRSVDEAFFERRVYTFSHSSNPDFGRPGWERTYPMTWHRIYPDNANS